MPFAGLGLHIVLALLCAYHVVRTGQQMYWLMILFAFPLLGSVVYFFAIVLPHSRLERGALRAVRSAARAMDPQRDVREARAALEDAPTAQNQMRLASALLDAGQAGEAASVYESCLKGPFASDLDIRYGAARAFAADRRWNDALTHLWTIRKENHGYRAEPVSLLIAECLAGQGSADTARAEYEYAVSTFGTFTAHAEYEMWARTVGDTPLAARLQAQVDRIMSRWNSQNRELNEPVLRRLRAMRSATAQTA